MYVKNLTISNLRAFRHTKIEFCYPDHPAPPAIPNVTLLLGDNGAGKTSVLRAVALAALAPVIGSSGFRPYKLVRHTREEQPDRATIKGNFLLHAQDTSSGDRKQSRAVSAETQVLRRGDLEEVTTRTRDEKVWEGIFQESSPAFLIVGYGASRRVESGSTFDSSTRAKSRFVRYQRVAGLFEEHLSLTPLGAWLPEFRRGNKGRHSQVIKLINNLLPSDTRILEEPQNGEYVFEHQGATVPFPAMSDGYRAYIGWISDLLYHVCMGAPSGYKLEENRGIVLVDEIDLHLHPAWQRQVVPQLASALPNLQFVLTSHSPLVAGTLQSGNLRLIEADETGASTVRQLGEYVHGLTADQILVSSYFGLDTPRAPQAISRLRELSARAQTGSRAAIDEFLRTLSGSTFSTAERSAIDSEDSAAVTAEDPRVKAAGPGSPAPASDAGGRAAASGGSRSAPARRTAREPEPKPGSSRAAKAAGGESGARTGEAGGAKLAGGAKRSRSPADTASLRSVNPKSSPGTVRAGGESSSGKNPQEGGAKSARAKAGRSKSGGSKSSGSGSP